VQDRVAGATTDGAAPAIVAPAFAPGALVAGRYRLESRLGAGGGGTVWRCTDEKLAMTVALKIVGSDGELERWRREVAMARRIADRNVCRVHDLGEADGVRFVTMEIVDGTGLRDLLAAGVRVEQARDLFTQVVSGVAAIHAAGVVHRDLKPDNVVVATDGRAVIVDFGLAREPRAPHDAPAAGAAQPNGVAAPGALAGAEAASGSMTRGTRHGAIVGTPRYMSPEQAAGEIVDVRTDVWALGLIAYELITGELPMYAADAKARIVDAAKLTEWPAIVPVLRKCLAVTPGDRYANARELRDAIGALKPTRRIGWLLAGAAVAALATAAVIGVALTRDRESSANRAPRDATATPAPAPVQVRQLGAGFSVAVSPDGTEYAYTLFGGRLFIAPLAGGEAREWKVPAIQHRGADGAVRPIALVTTWAVGWFSGRSIAVAAIAETGTWHVLRLFEDGRHTLLYSTTERFTASAAGDVAAIGMHENGIYVVKADAPEDLQQIDAVGNTEAVMGIAVSPDASRVAIARRAAGTQKAVIQVITLAGDKTPIWSGDVSNDIDQLLVWLDDQRLAFVHREPGKPAQAGQPAQQPTATLYAHDMRTRQTTKRYVWPAQEYAGIGSAARGELLVVGGRLARSVGIGGPRAEQLAPAHDESATGFLPAGWTSDGKLVFSLSQGDTTRVVRMTPGAAPETWPGLTGDERPNAVLDDSVIVHHRVGNELVIEKVSTRGTRKELHRMPWMETRYVVRCAGEQRKPCFIEESNIRDVTWRVFYPHTGEVGRVLHKRLRREVNMQSGALSGDGKLLAIVEGTSELMLVDVETASVKTIDTGTGELQTVAFAPDGSLWATAMGYRGQFFSLLKFAWRGDRLASDPTVIMQGPDRFFWRPTPSPDGKQLAIGLLDFHLVVSHLAGV
jgi:serine/threonine-protein kinase